MKKILGLGYLGVSCFLLFWALLIVSRIMKAGESMVFSLAAGGFFLLLLAALSIWTVSYFAPSDGLAKKGKVLAYVFSLLWVAGFVAGMIAARGCMDGLGCIGYAVYGVVFLPFAPLAVIYLWIPPDRSTAMQTEGKKGWLRGENIIRVICTLPLAIFVGYFLFIWVYAMLNN